MVPIIEEGLIEGLTIDENLRIDMEYFVDKYMKLVPNTNFAEEDFWDVAYDMVEQFSKSIDKVKERINRTKTF